MAYYYDDCWSHPTLRLVPQSDDSLTERKTFGFQSCHSRDNLQPYFGTAIREAQLNCFTTAFVAQFDLTSSPTATSGQSVSTLGSSHVTILPYGWSQPRTGSLDMPSIAVSNEEQYSGMFMPVLDNAQSFDDSMKDSRDSHVFCNQQQNPSYNRISDSEFWENKQNVVMQHWSGSTVSQLPTTSSSNRSSFQLPQIHDKQQMSSSSQLPKVSQAFHTTSIGNLDQSTKDTLALAYPMHRFNGVNESIYANLDNVSSDSSGWAYRHPCAWSSMDCVRWFWSVAEDQGLDPNKVNLQPFHGLNGPTLMKMGLMDFLTRDALHGELWYISLRKILDKQCLSTTQFLIPKCEPADMHGDYDHSIPFLGSMNMESEPVEQNLSEYMQDSYTTDEFDDIINLDTSIFPAGHHYHHQSAQPLNQGSYQYMNMMQNPSPQNFCGASLASDGTDYKTDLDSDLESNRSSCNNSTCTDMSSNAGSYGYHSVSPIEWNQASSPEVSPRRIFKAVPKGEKVKTSRSKHGTRGNHLWEFIRDILKNPKFCPKIVKWENREEGIFRFVESETVAKMWGNKKCNPRMTYEKLSRAMRYYYKSQILMPVIGRRLVYKFGPKATGWQEC